MRSIFVYGDFDWLDSPQLIGKLSYDRHTDFRMIRNGLLINRSTNESDLILALLPALGQPIITTFFIEVFINQSDTGRVYSKVNLPTSWDAQTLRHLSYQFFASLFRRVCFVLL